MENKTKKHPDGFRFPPMHINCRCVAYGYINLPNFTKRQLRERRRRRNATTLPKENWIGSTAQSDNGSVS